VKITILVPSLASNGIARAWILAKLLQRHYDVEVLGRLREGESVFPWFADYPWGEVRRNGLLEAVRAMERQITGDIVLAYGVSVASLAVGLLAKLRRHVPLILDMPEWEVHDHYKWQRGFSRSVMIARNLLGPGWSDAHSFKYRYILDHVTHLADERTVCCTFLQRRYGGVLLPQGPDTNQFDPATFDKMAIRRKWGIPEDATILFFGGNPQPNKGLEETIAALEALEGKVKARLVIVGRDASHPYTKKVVDRARGKAIALGPQPFHLMPELLATADIVALPQTKEPKSRGYVPCKIYEAMAMAIPVISSDLCDIPEILEGCGYVVPPEDSGALQDSLEHVLAHPEEAREMGRRARQRVIERYSWEAMDQILHRVVESVASKPTRDSARSEVLPEGLRRPER
jgi:glycosyltransferase involved in cell wall biosynthesis